MSGVEGLLENVFSHVYVESEDVFVCDILGARDNVIKKFMAI